MKPLPTDMKENMLKLDMTEIKEEEQASNEEISNEP